MAAPVRGGRVVLRGWPTVVRIGLVGQRAGLAVEVASLAARVGAVVVSLEAVSAASGTPAAGGIDLLLLDVDTAWDADARRAGSQGIPTAVICRQGEVAAAQAAADRLGCEHVVELPLGAAWLERHLCVPAGSGLLGVVGAVGGVGATTVAIACALAAGPDSLLVDADPDSPGLDLALGIAEGRGVRWPEIPDSAAPLDAGSLRAALPRVAGVTVVTGPGAVAPDPGSRSGTSTLSVPGGAATAGQLAGVVGVGRAEFPRTVVDLGRGAGVARLIGPSDTAALVLPASLAGVVSGRRVLEHIDAERLVILVRPSGWLPTTDVAEQLGVDQALEIPHLRRLAEMADCGDLLAGRTGRALRELGERVWGWHR